METREFNDLLTSLQQIVRQAYALGRSDALKQVVEVLKDEGVPGRPLALMAPTEPAAMAPTESVQQEASAKPEPSFSASNDDLAVPADDLTTAPWWARKPRKA